MNIDIILPYKEIFSKKKASAVSLTVKNSMEYSEFKSKINIYGQFTNIPFTKENFIGIKVNKIFNFGKNRSILKKSTLSILKHHVFNVQNFTNRKKNLWSHIECRIILNDIIGLLFSKKYFKGFVELFKLFCRYPIKLITHILFKLKRIFLFQSHRSFLK